MPPFLSVNVVSGDEVYSLVYCMQQERPTAAGEAGGGERVCLSGYGGCVRQRGSICRGPSRWPCCVNSKTGPWSGSCLEGEPGAGADSAS